MQIMLCMHCSPLEIDPVAAVSVVFCKNIIARSEGSALLGPNANAALLSVLVSPMLPETPNHKESCK